MPPCARKAASWGAKYLGAYPTKEETMFSACIRSAVAGACLSAMATAALAATGEYGNMCSMGLAMGKDVPTDCTVNVKLKGKPYCFRSPSALTQLLDADSCH